MRIRIIPICCFALICCGLLLIVRKANQPARLDQTKIVFEARPLVTNESVPLAEMPLEKLVEVTVATNDSTVMQDEEGDGTIKFRINTSFSNELPPVAVTETNSKTENK